MLSCPRLLTTALLLAALPACKDWSELYCDESRPCTDPDRPFCDLAGEHPASDGIRNTCIPDPTGGAGDAGPDFDDTPFCEADAFIQCSDTDTALYCNEAGTEYVSLDCDVECDSDAGGCYCEPNTSVCSNDTEVTCDADGKVEIESCALGCNDTGERCVDVDPSNGLAGYLDMTEDAPVVTLSNGAVIDTDAGTIEDGDGTVLEVPQFQVTAPEGGVAIRVFAVKSITFGDTTVQGSRALAIVSDGDILIHRHVRIEPGTGDVSTGSCVGGTSVAFGDLIPSHWSGGGGGGFGSDGADGGAANGGDQPAPGGGGGTTSGSATLVPLRGGCPGGAFDRQGGLGGGAGQFTSRTRIEATDLADIDAALSASGEGGGTYYASGGGSGGGILLEAPKVVVSTGTKIAANGGGGSGGCGSEGTDGRLSTTPAAGGECADDGYGAGGRGAGLTLGASVGETMSGSTAWAGGGGGGRGRIRVNVPVPSDFGRFGSVSPEPSVGTLQTR